VSHRYGDERIAAWLRENEYHPRSPKHGSASCLYLLDDLLYESEAFAEAAKDGELVYQEDYTVGEGPSRWNTDLVVGPPGGIDDSEVSPDDDRPIAEAEPQRIWLAIDAKSVMTEHGKARRNRQRDINSFADIMHRHHPGAVSGGLLLVNTAKRFRSPLRDEGDVTEHENIDRLVEQTIEIFEDIDRANGEISPNVDGVACVVVDHTNTDDGHETQLASEPPAPQLGTITNYREFLGILIGVLEDRFLRGEPPSVEDLREAESLEWKLNEEVIELAHYAHLVGRDLGSGSADRKRLDQLRDSVQSLEDVVNEVDQEYSEE
jgi:hypothetical protein